MSTLIISEIVTPSVTTGVNRYVSIWLEALQGYFRPVVYLRFEHSRERLFIREEKHEDYLQVTIPLPGDMSCLVSDRVAIQRYIDIIFPSIRKHFTPGSVLHLHTLNLIDLALRAQKEDGSLRIISHLHCIPWKGLYNSNKQLFYHLQRLNPTKHTKRRDFFVLPNEEDAYKHSDQIICVTTSGADFLSKLNFPESSIHTIYNGLPDYYLGKTRSYKIENPPKIIFIGGDQPSKGLVFILQCLNLVKEKGYATSLQVAGKVNLRHQIKLQESNPGLDILFLGNLSQEELYQHYSSADIGIIASIQEQCSYAAIEMMMFALPIITTQSDGLVEMFTQGENALITPVIQDEDNELKPDIQQMTSHLIRVINDQRLRTSLGESARSRYISQFSLSTMYKKTINLYNV